MNKLNLLIFKLNQDIRKFNIIFFKKISHFLKLLVIKLNAIGNRISSIYYTAWTSLSFEYLCIYLLKLFI